MAQPCRLVHAPSQPTYDLGANHPFTRTRQLPLFDLITSLDLLSEHEQIAPPSASRDLLELAHDSAYVDAIQALSTEDPEQAALFQAHEFGMGTSDNPITPGQHRAAAAIAGATVECIREVWEGTAHHACNTTGGLHHAMWSRASGFCVYNDLVVGIRAARDLGAQRVLYVDFDVHHGDGVEAAFAEDANVLTVSFHESPESLWPGTGRITDQGKGEGLGFAVNVPLQAGTDDTSWRASVDAVLPAVTRAFRPDLIVTQHGCDPHHTDPLANLNCTIASFVHAAKVSQDLANEVCSGKWVATGGGGYQPVTVTPLAWGALWCVMSGREIPLETDPDWRERWHAESGRTMPVSWLEDDPPGEHHAETVAKENAATVEKLLERIDWL